jgi:hypothetical protein
MTKGPSANFLVDINAVDEAGKPLYGPNGKILKRKVHMENGKFKDGTEQVLYLLFLFVSEALERSLHCASTMLRRVVTRIWVLWRVCGVDICGRGATFTLVLIAPLQSP